MNNTTMSQQEILNDLLNTEKSLVKLYASNITESSCPNLRQLMFSIMNECSQEIHCFDNAQQKYVSDKNSTAERYRNNQANRSGFEE